MYHLLVLHSTSPLCNWQKALSPHGRPLYKVPTGAVMPLRCSRNGKQCSKRHVRRPFTDPPAARTGTSAAPDITRFSGIRTQET